MDACVRGLGRELINRMRDAQQRLDHARETLGRCLAHRIENYRRGLTHALASLQARSPLRELMLRRNRFGDLQRRVTDFSGSKEFCACLAPTRPCVAAIASPETNAAN